MFIDADIHFDPAAVVRVESWRFIGRHSLTRLLRREALAEIPPWNPYPIDTNVGRVCGPGPMGWGWTSVWTR